MDPEEYRKQLERNIITIIEKKLRNGQMDAERAKKIARLVLNKLHPPLTLEQIYKIAPSLDDEFSELSAAIINVISDRNDEINKIVSKHAEELIKLGKIGEATTVIKNAMVEEARH